MVWSDMEFIGGPLNGKTLSEVKGEPPPEGYTMFRWYEDGQAHEYERYHDHWTYQGSKSLHQSFRSQIVKKG